MAQNMPLGEPHLQCINGMLWKKEKRHSHPISLSQHISHMDAISIPPNLKNNEMEQGDGRKKKKKKKKGSEEGEEAKRKKKKKMKKKRSRKTGEQERTGKEDRLFHVAVPAF